MIRVYVVEDHPVMRQTIGDYFALMDDIELCGMVDNAEDAIAGIEDTDPTVLLVDVALPGRSGLELVVDVRAKRSLPCVVLSGHGERTYVLRALSAGASGYVLKGNPAELPTAIRRAAAGKSYLTPTVRRAAE